jgi:hypothetical protein
VRYYYFDASVLVKAYFWEEGTEVVRQVIRDLSAESSGTRVATSRIAFVEAVSAVSRRTFAGEITPEQAEEVWNRIATDFAGYHLLEPKPRLLERAAELTRRHRLRAIDAIHLATGLAARRQAPAWVDFQFGSADRRLNVAATAELFDVFNPESPVPPGTSTPVTPSE